MNKTKIIVTIVGSGLVASLAAAISIFPDLTTLLASLSTLITAIAASINGANNK